jgi:outer membrane biosynthesis protein TonB
MEAPVPETHTPATPSVDELHLLISEMDDELSSYRWREAIWVSIVFHIVVFLCFLFGPRFLPRSAVLLPVSEMSKQQPTFLQLPPSLERHKIPKTNIISDQNRIAQSRTPNYQPPRPVMNAQAPGTPAPKPAPQQQAAQQQAQPQPQQQGSGSNQATTQEQQQQQPTQTARLETPPEPKGPSPFKAAMAPGAAIDQAVHATASGHSGSRVAFGGDYGASRHQANTDIRGDVEILSDTMGVDFGPYLQRVLWEIKKNWYNAIPEVARPPIMKKGKLTLKFAILKNGQVAGLSMVTPSGDIALDRAAWSGITGSDPFDRLPPEFKGQFLELGIRFLYNPNKDEME